MSSLAFVLALAASWPTLAGPLGNGKSPESGLDLRWGDAGPRVAWEREVGEGYSMATVWDERLFFFDAVEGEARLVCLEAGTGREVWSRSYPFEYEDDYGYSVGPKASPTTDGERVYAYGIDGILRAHRVADGELLWEVDTVARFGVRKNFFGVGSTPIVEGDLLIVPVGGSPPDSPPLRSGALRGNGSGVVAFDRRTGEVRYRLSDELASYASPVVARIGERRLGFAFLRGGLLAFEPRKGKELFFFPWRARKLESVNAASPVVFDDKVFITESYERGGALLRVGQEGFETIWTDTPRDETLASHWSTPIFHEGFLYGSSGRSSGNATLRCVGAGTRKVRWSVPDLGRSTLLWVDGHFVVWTEYGRLLVIEATPEGFRPRASWDFGAGETPRIRHPAWAAPILSRGLLYVRGEGRLLALDLRRP